MIASLPMYLTPRTREATALLWAGVRDRLRARGMAAPDDLTEDIADLIGHWTAPGLTLSQTCGMPYRLKLHGKVTLVGTPDYGLPDCAPGHYRSVVVARAGEAAGGLASLAGRRFAYNEPISQSGWAALAAEAPEVLTGPRLRTGAHRASARAVAEGAADFAAIDAVTWRLARDEGLFGGLAVVHETRPTPGLPLIAAAGADRTALFEAVAGAIDALPSPHRRTLGLRGLVAIPPEAYLAVPTPPAP